MIRSSHRTALGVSTLLVALAGCAAGGSGSASSEPADPSPTMVAPDPAVERAYYAYWDAWLAANRAPNGPDRLDPVLAQPLLGVLRETLHNEAAAGHDILGAVSHHIQGMHVDGETRVIVDCVDVNHWLTHDATTGALTSQLVDRPPQLTVLTLRRIGGVWKVTDGQQPQAC